MGQERQYCWETENLRRERRRIHGGWIVVAVLSAAVLAALWLSGIFEPEIIEEGKTVMADIPLMPEGQVIDRLKIELTDQAAYVLIRDTSDHYAVEGMDDFALNQDLADTMMRRAGQITAERIVASKVDDLKPYGLENPWLAVEVNDTRLIIGNTAPSISSRYAMRLGDENIYTVSQAAISALARELNDLHVVSMPSVLSDEGIDYVYIEKSGGETIELSRAEAEKSPLLTSFFMLQPYRYPAHSYRVSGDIVPGIVQIKPFAYAGHMNAPEDAADYGLDIPWAYIHATDDLGGEIEVTIGREVGPARYITVDDSGDVYLIESEELDFLQYARSDYLAEQFVSLVSIEHVSHVDISVHGVVLTLEIEHEASGAYRFRMNGVMLNSDEGQVLYEQIIGIQHDVRCPNPEVAGDEEMSICFILLDGSKYVVEYLSYDADYLAVRINGNLRFMVKRDKLNPLKEALKSYSEE